MKRLDGLAVVAATFLLSTKEAQARGCREVSDVVGEQKCTQYGAAWSVERALPFLYRFGFRYGEFSTADATFRESFKKKHRPAGYEGYRFNGDALGVPKLTAYGMDGGFLFNITGQLYMGLEGGLGFGTVDSRTFTTGAHTLTNDTGVDVLMFHGGAPIGYRVPLGRASLRGEMFLGAVGVDVSHNVNAPTIAGAPTSASSTALRWLVEPRIAADIWFTQHISFGVYGGVNLVDTNARSMGLILTFHNRAFDGEMSLW